MTHENQIDLLLHESSFFELLVEAVADGEAGTVKRLAPIEPIPSDLLLRELMRKSGVQLNSATAYIEWFLAQKSPEFEDERWQLQTIIGLRKLDDRMREKLARRDPESD
jgi:hypothetical protein